MKVVNSYLDLGRPIRLALASWGWKIEDLAKLMGLTRGGLQYQASNLVQPTPENLRKLCDVLGISMRAYIALSGPPETLKCVDTKTAHAIVLEIFEFVTRRSLRPTPKRQIKRPGNPSAATVRRWGRRERVFEKTNNQEETDARER